jgi:5-carboxymethyl-2-hydroxymuconate isomerase
VPHLTLEYTANLAQDIPFSSLFSELHQVLSNVCGVHVANCKSRAVRHETYVIGQGEVENAFVHLTVQIMKGRSPELKGELGCALMEVLQRYYTASAAQHRLQITVEIRDLQRAAYFKAT